MDTPAAPITVVSGLPRSGTSMMMQVLAAGGMSICTDHARARDEDNPRGYFELEAAKALRRDNAWLTDARGKAVKIVHLLLPDLPPIYGYRVLFMQRDLAEVLASQQAMLRRQGKTGADLSPERLAATFEQQLHKVNRWLDEQQNVSVLRVRYEQMLAEPLRCAEAIRGFLGDALDVKKMAAAVDPTLYRQRR